MLAGLAALRVGAGVLAMALPDEVALPVAVAVPEASATAWGGPSGDPKILAGLLDSADAVLVGPGLDDPEVAKALVEHVAGADYSGPVLLDAYALGVLGDAPEAAKALAGRLILTPNQDEAKFLADTTVEDRPPAEIAQRIAQRWDAVVSYSDAVATPADGTHALASGNPGLGTSGSGDVLAGAIAGLLARGADPDQSACWGTYLHSAAGDRLAARVGRLGYLAREVVEELPVVLTELQA
jgi:hydroxyethylthiazole kinase-like uncharacterized protein yjeF